MKLLRILEVGVVIVACGCSPPVNEPKRPSPAPSSSNIGPAGAASTPVPARAPVCVLEGESSARTESEPERPGENEIPSPESSAEDEPLEPVRIAIATLKGTPARTQEARDAVVARIQWLDAQTLNAAPASRPRFRALRVKTAIESHADAEACATALGAPLVIWGSVLETPPSAPPNVLINPTQIVSASPAPTVGTINANGQAKVLVGTVSATLSVTVNVPAAKPFAMLLNATSVRYSGTMLANSRFDVGSLSDIATAPELSGTALAAIPFVAGYSSFDKRNYAQAEVLFEAARKAAAPTSEPPKPKSATVGAENGPTHPSIAQAHNPFSERAAVMRAASLIWGRDPKVGTDALTEALKRPLAAPVEWQARVLRAFGLGLLGRHREAARDLLRAAVLADSDARLEAQRGMAQLSSAIIAGVLGDPAEAFKELAISKQKRARYCDTATDARSSLICSLNDLQELIVKALALQWLDRKQDAGKCIERVTTDVERLMARVQKSPEWSSALPFDAPNGGGGCEAVHLKATGSQLYPDLAKDAVDIAQFERRKGTVGHVLMDAATSPLLRLSLACGVVLNGLTRGDPNVFLSSGLHELAKRDGSKLLGSELRLIRALWLANGGDVKAAANIVAAELPTVRGELGAQSVPAQEWANYLVALRTGKRPTSKWRATVSVPSDALCVAP